MKRVVRIVLWAMMSGGILWAQAEPNALAVGDRVESFNANTDAGELWRLADHLSPERVLVVYFYPAAMTGGCTAQACGYRDMAAELARLGAEVVGVSGDSVQGLKVFKQAYDLSFTLLSDVDGCLARRFGVPTREGGNLLRHVGETEVTLRRGLTAARWTFILDGRGRLLYRRTEVDAARDAQAVLEFLRERTRR